MKSKVVTIINKLGLHARAAARFVQLASSFDSDVSITVNGKKVSGKSIMGIMMLAASKGTSVELVTAGSDEAEAINSLENLILDKFGEAE